MTELINEWRNDEMKEGTSEGKDSKKDSKLTWDDTPQSIPCHRHDRCEISPWVGGWPNASPVPL